MAKKDITSHAEVANGDVCDTECKATNSAPVDGQAEVVKVMTCGDRLSMDYVRSHIYTILYNKIRQIYKYLYIF